MGTEDVSRGQHKFIATCNKTSDISVRFSQLSTPNNSDQIQHQKSNLVLQKRVAVPSICNTYLVISNDRKKYTSSAYLVHNEIMYKLYINYF
jgi:hypothetical protein